MQLENYVAISSVPGESGQFWQLALFVITLITRLVLIKKLCLKDDIPSPSGSDIAEGGGSSGEIVTMLCLTISLMFHSWMILAAPAHWGSAQIKKNKEALVQDQ